MLTQHNDSSRTGVNQSEPKLKRATIRNSLRKLHEVLIDPPSEGGPTAWASQVVAQPLFVPNVHLPDGSTKDILLVFAGLARRPS